MATLPRLRQQLDGLKPSLSTWLMTHPYRQRALAVDVSAITLEPYSYQEHGTDVLLYWYAQVRQLGEHVSLWGSYLGNSPSRFVAQAVAWELLWLSPAGEQWPAGHEAVGVAWGDDGQVPNRQRLHFWVAPAYRHPRTTTALLLPVLDYFFARYHVLWGITPATNVLALRALKRWGFQRIGCLPQSEGEGTAMVDGVVSALTRQEWVAQGGGDAEAL